MLLCDGSAVSRVTYAKLFSVIGTSYGAGDGSTSFNVPNLVDKFVQGNATSGTVKSAGLPELYGETFITAMNSIVASVKLRDGGGVFWGGHSSSGSFNATSAGVPTGDTFDYLGFRASKYNSIYGNSTTVQPPALTMQYIIKY